jgi:hypothetical protein
MMSKFHHEIEQPVFILGTGRSGTTLFFNLLALHPHFAWFSNYNSKYPNSTYMALLSRLRDLPFAGRLVQRQWVLNPKPVESYNMLNYLTNSIFTQRRTLTESDVSDKTRERFRYTVSRIIRIQRKRRFIHKHTGFPRIAYLRAIFPDALFIHVCRDGRAVANSMNEVSWWSGDLNSWWWGDMKDEYMQEYVDFREEPIILAGIVWKTLMDLIEEEAKILQETQYMRVRYDVFVHDPWSVMEEVLHFCNLPKNDTFFKRLAKQEIFNMDSKWVQRLSPKQKAQLNQSLSSHLQRYGFQI